MTSLSSVPRLKWACRRGMLELDLILLPFFEDTFDQLTAPEQSDFEALLTCPDQDLYAWLLNFQACPELRYHPLLAKIRAYVDRHCAA